MTNSSTENVPMNEKTSVSSGEQNNLAEETKMRITMRSLKDTYSLSSDRVNVIITNNTSAECYTDAGYSIEYYNGSTWSKIPLDFIIEDILNIVQPKKSREFSIYLHPKQHHYVSGKYRICKTVGTYELTSEFNLQ